MDFQSILDRFRVPYDISGKNKNRPGWVNFQCPYCGRDPYMGYNISYRALSCWACGRQPLGETLRLLTGLTGSEVYQLIGELPREDFIPPTKKRGTLQLPIGVEPMAACHKAYLKNRGFDPAKIAKLWGVQGINFLGGFLAWRLFIPVYFGGEVVTWTTRKLNDEGQRYHSAKSGQSIIPIEETVYGIDYCRSSGILVEGPTDVWTIGPGAIDVFGVRVGSAQFRQILQLPRRIICFDSGAAGADEAAAQKRARKLCQELSAFSGTTINIRLESGNDPASCDPREIQELRDKYLR